MFEADQSFQVRKANIGNVSGANIEMLNTRHAFEVSQPSVRNLSPVQINVFEVWQTIEELPSQRL